MGLEEEYVRQPGTYISDNHSECPVKKYVKYKCVLEASPLFGFQSNGEQVHQLKLVTM